jgi:hypothetical protein
MVWIKLTERKNMKRLVIMISIAGLINLNSYGQGIGGFFSQQSSKEKLMLTQIAELHIYASALKTGYTITEKGINTAHDLKNGTFSLHTAYFNSLEQVSPAVSGNPKGKAILDTRQKIVSQFTAEITWQQTQKLLHPDELAYLQKVYANLLKEAQKDLDELNQVLTPGQLQLTDQQRLQRLDHLYAGMKDKYVFTGSFTTKCRKVALARQQAKRENEQLKKLYGIN